MDRLKRMVTASSVFGLIKALEGRELMAELPQAVSAQPKIRELVERASSLARSSLDDSEAADVLSTAVGARRKLLLQAAALIRSDGLVGDVVTDCRANRLLLQAAGESVIPILTPDEKRHFERVRALRSMTHQEGYSLLVTLQPSLNDVQKAIEGRDTTLSEIISALENKVGLNAASGDSLVRSQSAWFIARDYLSELAGIDISQLAQLPPIDD